MKKISYLLLVLIYLSFFNSCKDKVEDKFMITGRISGISDSTKVMLQNITTGEYLDSTIVLNSEFEFNGSLVDEPEELRIISALEEIQKGKFFYTDLLMGNEDLKLSADISGLPYHVETSGSPSQEAAEKYYKQLYSWNLKIDSLKVSLEAFSSDSVTAEMTLLEDRIKEVKDSFEVWKITFLEKNFNSYIALLTYNYRRDFQTDKLKSLFSGISDELKSSKYGKAIQTQIAYPKPQIGEKYYDFESINLKTNSPLKLTDVKDKYILLQFAGTTCYGSNLSVQNMKMIEDIYKDTITFISTFFEPQKEICGNYIDENNISWLASWTDGGKYGVPANQYGITGTPTFFLISPEKEVIATWFGYRDGIIEDNIKQSIEQKRYKPDINNL